MLRYAHDVSTDFAFPHNEHAKTGSHQQRRATLLSLLNPQYFCRPSRRVRSLGRATAPNGASMPVPEAPVYLHREPVARQQDIYGKAAWRDFNMYSKA